MLKQCCYIAYNLRGCVGTVHYTTAVVSPRVHVFHIYNKHTLFFFYIFIRLNTTIYYEHVSDNNNCIEPLRFHGTPLQSGRHARVVSIYVCV